MFKEGFSFLIRFGDGKLDFRNRNLWGKTERPPFGKLDHARSDPLPLPGLVYGDSQDLGNRRFSSFLLSDTHHEKSNRNGDVRANLFGYIRANAW